MNGAALIHHLAGIGMILNGGLFFGVQMGWLGRLPPDHILRRNPWIRWGFGPASVALGFWTIISA